MSMHNQDCLCLRITSYKFFFPHSATNLAVLALKMSSPSCAPYRYVPSDRYPLIYTGFLSATPRNLCIHA